MRNRAKCKLCKEVIESFHSTDYVICSCNEIFVDGGSSLRCGAKNWENFARIDSNGVEIPIRILQTDITTEQPILNKEKIVRELEILLENIQSLPDQAMITPINHYDYASLLMVLVSLFKLDLKDDI